MDRDIMQMIEAELLLEVQREDLERVLGAGKSTYDVAQAILARKPELSGPTREYLMMRGLADFLGDGVAFAAEMRRTEEEGR